MEAFGSEANSFINQPQFWHDLSITENLFSHPGSVVTLLIFFNWGEILLRKDTKALPNFPLTTAQHLA